jgi:hypothetical protein
MAVPDGYIIDAESETASAGEDLVEEFPLSFGQQRLWFLAQIEGASEAYNEPFGLRLHGKLDRIALRRALDHIVFRHEVFAPPSCWSTGLRCNGARRRKIAISS